MACPCKNCHRDFWAEMKRKLMKQVGGQNRKVGKQTYPFHMLFERFDHVGLAKVRNNIGPVHGQLSEDYSSFLMAVLRIEYSLYKISRQDIILLPFETYWNILEIQLMMSYTDFQIQPNYCI